MNNPKPEITNPTNNGSRPDMRSSALWYARNGFHVIPLHNPTADDQCSCGDAECISIGKHPRTANGVRDATTDEAAIKRWWTQWPDANIGVTCGPSGLVVIDIDPRNGGDDSWEALRDTLTFDTHTWMCLTGSGGQHYYYQLTNGTEPTELKGKLGAGVDVKRGNGYVVAPPSLHPNGRRYEFEASSHPREVDIVPLPEALLSELKRNGTVGGATVKFCNRLPDVTNLTAVLDAHDVSPNDDLHTFITEDPRKTAKRLGKDSRSEVDQSVIVRLRKNGASPELIKAIFLQYPVGEKYREKGQQGDDYLATCIQSADAFIDRKPDDGVSTAEDGSEEKDGPRTQKLLTQDYIDLYHEWGYGVKLNLCNDDIEVNGEVLNDVTESQIKSKVRDYGTINKVGISVQHAVEALVDLSAQNAYHPIREYLERLKWDGGDHIKAFTSHFRDKEGVFGKWMRHWLVGCVAKTYEGYQNPMIVLDGAQDIGKSYAANWLCSPLPSFFLASAIYPENKDHRLRLIQTWIWEVEELGATTRKADVEALKAFITLKTVRERKAYGRRDIIKPALASFIGTINNDSGFLVDRTGNRRFLVCTLESIDWSYSQRINVDQLWAHAIHIYRSGDDDWRLTDDDKAQRDEINNHYMVDDPVEAYICQDYTFTGNPEDRVTLPEVLDNLEGRGIRPSRWVTMQIASTMRSHGATKKRKRINGPKEYVYFGVREKRAGDDELYKPVEEIVDELRF